MYLTSPQVLSKSVADAFAICRDLSSSLLSDITETERFCRMFDKFFDCMNTRCIQESKHKRKPDLRPYYSPNDSRLKVRGALASYLDIHHCCHVLTVAAERIYWLLEWMGGVSEVKNWCSKSWFGTYDAVKGNTRRPTDYRYNLYIIAISMWWWFVIIINI